MRELWSRRLAVLTAMLVLLLSYAVATLRNPAESRTPATPETNEQTTVTPAADEDSDSRARQLIETGRTIYSREGCARCHGAAGAGSALDDVADRLTPEEIRQWTVASAAMEDNMPGWAFSAKQRYGKLPASDLEALVVFLQSLRSGAEKSP
jgi:mono/diheme cytochrome c family protein